MNDEPLARLEYFRMPLAERRARLAAGWIDEERYRSDLVDYVCATDPLVRAFADWRPDDLARSGVPRVCTVTYKDTIDVAGYPTRLGIRSGYRHYPRRSAEIVRLLSGQGLVCVGKAAVTECALGADRPSRNPVHPQLSASGSSTGSAAAVAAGFCDVSVGTDSAGSIRWPAVYCGATALRLTPRDRWLDGVHAVSPSMESVGLIARSPADLAWLWRSHRLGATLQAEPERPRSRLRIGFSRPADEPLHPEMAAMVRTVGDLLDRSGHEVDDVDLEPAWARRPQAWELLMREAYDGFGHLLADGHTALADDTRRILEAGGAVPRARHRELLDLRQQTAHQLGELLSGRLDLLLVPLETGLPDPEERRYASTVPAGQQDNDLTLTVLASFAGLPVLALPAGRAAGGQPLGLQVMARPGGENLLLAAGQLIGGLTADLARPHRAGTRPDEGGVVTAPARVAVVTGGGTGIGRAVAERLAAEGAEVVIVGRRQQTLAATGAALGERVTPFAADVAQAGDVVRLADFVRERFGRLDVLVNNAGYLLPVTLADPDAGAAALVEVLSVHVLGAYLVTAHLSSLLARPGGRVVNISSIAASTGGSGAGAAQGYAAAKAGLIGLTYGMARELGPQGITVNAVAPGFVADTGFTESFGADRVRWLVDQTMVGRAGEVADIAAAVSYLAGEDAHWVCGQVLHVNGGALFGR